MNRLTAAGRCVVLALAAAGSTSCEMGVEPQPEVAVFSSLAAGDHTVCGIAQGGAVLCTPEHAAAFEPTWDIDLQALSIGNPSFPLICGIDLNGEGLCWKNATPQRLPGNHRFQSIDAQTHHACGLATTGAAYCWGIVFPNGAIGDPFRPFGQAKRLASPTRYGADLTFAQISGGRTHTCGITPAGKAYCWGRNGIGQLGTTTELEQCAITPLDPRRAPTLEPCAPSPVPVAGDLQFTSLAAGYSHTCALTHDGTIYCWGSDVPDFRYTDYSFRASVPTEFAPGLKLARISARLHNTCGLTVDGAAFCWGAEAAPIYPGSPAWTPIAFAPETRFRSIVATGSGVCGIATDERVLCSGGPDGRGYWFNVPTEIARPLIAP